MYRDPLPWSQNGRWGLGGVEWKALGYGTIMRGVEFYKQVYIPRRFWFLQLGILGTQYTLESSQSSCVVWSRT